MQSQEETFLAATADRSLLGLADLQDNLLTVVNDLERLEALLANASQALMADFHEASILIAKVPTEDVDARDQAARRLAGAITGLQFQDMASQLLGHACRRLDHCANRLASDAIGDDDEGVAIELDAPTRPNPVAQSEMDAGSIELF